MLENFLLFIAGLMVGVINTLSGSGSAIILPLLMYIGLPAGIANATNRLGVLFQTGVSSFYFWRKGMVKPRYFSRYVVPSLIGALLGAYLASIVLDSLVEQVVFYVILFILFSSILLYFLQKRNRGGAIFTLSVVGYYILFFLLGMYGGFIQAGLGIVIIGILHYVLNENLKEVNVVKNLLTFCYTVPVFLFFIYHEMVSWRHAIFLALGQAIGGYFSARMMVYMPSASKWAKGLFYVMLILLLVKVFFIK